MAATAAEDLSSLVPVVASVPLQDGIALRRVQRQSDAAASVQNETDKGRGAFATRCFAAGSVVMRELPYASIQDVENRHRAWTCAHCSAFLQSLEGQLKWHRRHADAVLGEDEEEVDGEGDEGTSLPEGVLLRTDVVECWHACGEMYCSEHCRDEAYSEYHEALCVGRVDSEMHPLVVFKKHAIEHNELFLLAAHVVVRIFNTIRSSKTNDELDLGFADRFLNSFCHRPWLDVLAEAQDTRKAARATGNSDDEDEDEDDGEEEIPPELLKHILEESYFSLSLALFSPPSPFSAEVSKDLQKLFTMDFYSDLLGLLEMNQNAMRIGSPLQSYAAMLHDHIFPSSAHVQHDETLAVEPAMLPSFDNSAKLIWARLCTVSEKIKRAEEIINDDDDEECDEESDDHHHDRAHKEHGGDSTGNDKGKGKIRQEEDSDDEEAEEVLPMFPEFQGFGLFPIAAMMNHSCEPNTLIKFGRNREARVVALRDIAENEELTHSYIENDQPLAERRADLLEYNFICQCSRCSREEN